MSSEYDEPPMKTTATPVKVAPAKIKESSSEEDSSSEDRTPPAKKTVSHRPSRHEPLRVTAPTLPLAAPGTSHTPKVNQRATHFTVPGQVGGDTFWPVCITTAIIDVAIWLLRCCRPTHCQHVKMS